VQFDFKFVQMNGPKEIKVRLPQTALAYPIMVGRGLLGQARELLENALPATTRRIVIVSNAKVLGLYGEALLRDLKRSRFAASPWLMGDGERFKSWRSLEQATAAFAVADLERSDAVIALGGGVVGDLAGFAAATYLRGITLVQIPTTLLAQIDSSVGGKTGVNTSAGKNSIGAFHHPAAVLIDPETLSTLPRRELTAGWCEAIKQAAIADRKLFDLVVEVLRDGSRAAAADERIDGVIRRLCAVKAKIVSGDPRENLGRSDARSRKVLNFGHTVGHALEAVTRYRRFKHGEAVGLGMLVAGEIAKKLGILPAVELELLESAVKLAGRLPPTRDLNPADIMESMKHDKKRVGDSLKWVLLEQIGSAQIVDGRNISASLIRAALRSKLAN
jgi:3-dehydroquinate synthase